MTRRFGHQARACAFFSRTQSRAIARPILQQRNHFIIESNRKNSICWAQLLDEGYGRLLYILHAQLGRAARVDQEHDREGLLNGREVANLLRHPVLEDLKIILVQVRHETPFPIPDAYRNGDEVRLDPDGLFFAGSLIFLCAKART